MTKFVVYVAAPDSVPVIRCSPPSWAAQIALIEEEIPNELRWLRFDRGEHRSDSMLQINPQGTVPVLVDGKTVITETVELLEHIVRRSPCQKLAVTAATGHEAAERLTAAREIKDGGMAAFRALMKGSGGESPWTSLKDPLDRWEGVHSSDACRFDLTDLLVFVYVATAQSLGFSMNGWPELEACAARTASRASVAACWPATWPA